MNYADAYLERLYEGAERRHSVRGALRGGTALEAWREGLLAALPGALGREPEDVAPNANVLETTELYDDAKHINYTRIKLLYDSEAALTTIAYLLIPKGLEGPAPAVVACTGHGYGVRDIVGLREDFSERDGESTYQKDFGLELVRRGYAVIAPEPVGFGELRLSSDVAQDKGNSCDRISDNLLLVGRTMMGARVRQYRVATTILAGLEEVDETRIGAMGISGGGLTSAFLTMTDARIKALVCSGYPCLYKDSIYAMYHCVDNFPFGLLNLAECDDLMALIAPRPQLWESGSRDPIFPRAGVREAEKTVRSVYEALEVGDRFDVDYFEGEHEISGRKAYDFFAKYL